MDNLGFQSDILEIQRGQVNYGGDNNNKIVRDKEQNVIKKGIVNVNGEGTCVEECVVEEDRNEQIDVRQRKENPRFQRIHKGEENVESNKSEVDCFAKELTITSRKDFEDNFHVGERPSQTLQQMVYKHLSKRKCSPACMKRFLSSIFPFINIMKNYNIRQNISGDIVAGLSIGILHIPQGMANAMLATLSPVYGLYTSFFPVLFYFFLGTSKHISLGTSSIPCIMIGSVISKGIDSISGPITSSGLVPSLFENHTGIQTETTTTTLPAADDIPDIPQDENELRLQVAMSLTFMAGVIQLLMSVFRLGCITDFMSDALICGFTTGVACHAFTSQLKNIFSVNHASYSGAFKLIYIYRDFFTNIATTNYITVLISVSSMAVIYFTSRLINQNPKLRRKMFMPVPTELIVVVIGTVISYVLNLEQSHNVPVVSDIPTGLPVPNTKWVSRMSWTLLLDTFPIVIVIFSISISIAKVLAKEHSYEVDADQELLAFGISSVACSFMSTLTPMVALSRSVLQDKVGGKTQVAGLVSCCLLLVVLLVVGPYFKTTPKCILSSVIVVSLRALFLQLLDLKNIYRVSKTDFFVWIVAFISTVLLDVDLGLGVAVAFNLLIVIRRIQRPYASLLGQMPGTDLYGDISVYQKAKEMPGIKLFRYEQSLFFLNKEHFLTMLYKSTVNPATLALAEERRKQRLNKAQKNSKTDLELDIPGEFNIDNKQKSKPDADFRTLIIDCSPWNFVDSVGVNALASVITEYKAVGMSVILANCKDGILQTFERTKFYNTLDKSNIYVTLHDAVSQALCYQSSSADYVQIEKAEEVDSIY